MKITFAHFGPYYKEIEYLLKNITNKEILVPPKITKKTIALGEKYSPNLICLPFKYNLGNFIESLENKADTIIHIGGGCKFGYYCEVQMQILKDLGYKFNFYNLMKEGNFSISRAYKIFLNINPHLTYYKFIKVIIYTLIYAYFSDKLEDYIRRNKVLIIEKDKIDKICTKSDTYFKSNKSILKLIVNNFKVINKIKSLKKIQNSNNLKICIIGELYSNIEVSSSSNLEETLINMGFIIKRFTNASYLLVFTFLFDKLRMKFIKKYVKYNMGADASANVYRVTWAKRHKYDGIIHIKPFGCTPEIGVIPVLESICEDNNIPIMFLTFESQNSDIGINTRLEAFYDMLKMRKEKLNE
ncbi:MAG: hypothetical protein RSB41_00190 [Bacilli bacterium]